MLYCATLLSTILHYLFKLLDNKTKQHNTTQSVHTILHRPLKSIRLCVSIGVSDVCSGRASINCNRRHFN